MEIFLQNSMWAFVVILLWVLPWKIYSLWTSARNSHKGWFFALLILNTFAILDIFYIFYVAKKNIKDVKEAVKKTAREIKADVSKLFKKKTA